MPRTFNGSSDRLRLGLGNCNMTGAVTLAAIINKNGGDGNWHCLISNYNSGGAWQLAMEVSTTNQLYADVGASTGEVAPTITVTAAQDWQIVAACKAAGTTVWRFHRLLLAAGNSWIHENSSGTDVNPATQAGGYIEVGDFATSADWFNGDIAIAGEWARQLTDAEIETLAFSYMAWLSTSPNGLWIFDQSAVAQTVIDHMGGGANQTAIAGTTVATASVPSISYGHPVLRQGKQSQPPQFARPDADVAAGGWTTSPLWSKIDEAVTDDADFITATAT